jgi:nitrogen regulatory protein P-II 1
MAAAQVSSRRNAMKKIEATINPFELDDVRDALVELGITGMSVCEVKSFDPQAHSNWYRGAEYTISFTPRVKIEMVVEEEQLGRCLAAIKRCAGADDAARAVVLPVEDTVHIRTGEHTARAA